MGLKYGERLRRRNYVPPPPPPQNLKFVKDCETIVERYLPELLEEIEGIAEGGNFDVRSLKALVLTLNVGGCSAVAINGKYTRDGKTLFGRNYDFFPSFRKFIEVYRTSPADGLSSIACTDIFVGREDGVNEAGLAIAAAYVGFTEFRPGIIFTLALRGVLDHCHDVDEAIMFLKNIPHPHNINFLVADSSGGIAIIEANPKKVRVKRLKEFGAITNHFQSKEMSIYENSSMRPESSIDRLNNLRNWFNRKNKLVGIEDLKLVLSDRKNGVCQYNGKDRRWVEPIFTLWSWVTKVGKRNIQLAEGAPNRARYKPYSF